MRLSWAFYIRTCHFSICEKIEIMHQVEHPRHVLVNGRDRGCVASHDGRDNYSG